MNKLQQLWLLTAVAAVGVMAGGYFVLVAPQAHKTSALRASTKVQQSTNLSLQSQIDMLKEQAKSLPREQARLAEIAQKIPNNPALPSVIRSLSDLAEQHDVELVSLMPQVPQRMSTAGTAGGTAVSGSTGTGSAAASLAILPVELNLVGSYADIEELLAGLESLPRAMLVSDVDLSPASTTVTVTGTDAGTGAGTDTGLLAAKVNGRLFMTTSTAADSTGTPVTATTATTVK